MNFGKNSFQIGLFLFSLFYGNMCFAQLNIENQVKTLEYELTKVRQDQLDMISPKNYANALNEFNEAREDLKKGKKISDILKKLEKTNNHLGLVKQVGEQGRVLFKDLLQARKDALNVYAPEYAVEEFQESEQKFLEAGKRLERGDLNGARHTGFEAERCYRDAELIAIKETIVSQVRELLDEAEKKKTGEFAPYTLKEAENLYKQVIDILNNNRYLKNDARALAENAEYEAQHAIYLADVVEKLKKNDQNLELLIRDFEGRIDHIAQKLGFEGDYTSGLAKTVDDILLAVQNLQEENIALKKELETYQKDITHLREKVQEYEKTVVSELEQKRKWEEKLHKIETIFSPAEAQVLLSGNYMIIRLYGLTFQSGSKVILPEHFMLLTKVMRALREFPTATVEVAGHTDAIGNDAYNFQLSEDRASAVRIYLEANMGRTNNQFRSIGYGEERPIASNESQEGRQLNRRIEILIDLIYNSITENNIN
jgi:OOP family OmpA-OmpF porin